MNDHLSDERINDLLDGLLTRDEAAVVEPHLAACATCREIALRLRLLATDADALPRSVMPERDLWPALRAELGRRGRPVRVIPVRRPPAWAYRSALAAAAAVVFLVSVAIVRHVAGDRVAVATRVDSAGAAAVLPTTLVSVERDYQRAAAELRASLDAQRGSLAPETIARVERSLDVIDAAIAEARDALVHDPGNQALADMLAASYGRKLDLLRRATELPSRT
jgi:anti-sigma factor RsiW